MMRRKELPMRAICATAIALLVAASASAQQVTQENVTGVTNFKRLDTTIACAGATTAQGIPELKKMGYASVINLRLPSENGANIDEEAAAAQSAGIHFIHIPFNGSSPDPTVADKFLAAVTARENQPAFVHCASGNRAAALWMVKRLVVDKWDSDRAFEEAKALGLSSPALKQFATDYAEAHKH
jgi:uncharacterized protein (TIGR01244 family)